MVGPMIVEVWGMVDQRLDRTALLPTAEHAREQDRLKSASPHPVKQLYVKLTGGQMMHICKFESTRSSLCKIYSRTVGSGT
jgi:hypothetical protein